MSVILRARARVQLSPAMRYGQIARPIYRTSRALPSSSAFLRQQSTASSTESGPTKYPATPATTTATDIDGVERRHASFYISNVLPTMVGSFDPRPWIALLREESIMERLEALASEIKGHGFRVESWEASRKDGGIFMHFSYILPGTPQPESQSKPPFISEPDSSNEKEKAPRSGSEGEEATTEDDSTDQIDWMTITSSPEVGPKHSFSPARAFIPQMVEATKKHGAFPSWLGDWVAFKWSERASTMGHAMYTRGIQKEPVINPIATAEEKAGTAEDTPKDKSMLASDGPTAVLTAGDPKAIPALLGNGRLWYVKGQRWTEDMNRFPSARLRVEFDGADVSQEMLYSLFRPYGRLVDIYPPSPVPAGSLRFAVLRYDTLASATIAISCLHGYSTPTNTADFVKNASGKAAPGSIAKTRLRIYHDRPVKAHVIREWITGHPRLVLPLVAFLIGTLSYTFFDPIRAFFVRSKLEGMWDLEQYSIIKSIRSRFTSSFSFFNSSGGSGKTGDGDTAGGIGKNAWKDRVEAEKDVERWLTEYPSTFITITGPPGSGKESLVKRVLGKQSKPSIVIDCSEVGKAKTDKALLDALAEQTGYWPVFSFLSSLNGLIDLAAVGLIGQKAGFSTPIDQQLRSVLDVVGGALKDTSTHTRDQHKEQSECEEKRAEMLLEDMRREELIKRGGWHDGRLDCIAGNGVMSELGLGDEPFLESDLSTPLPSSFTSTPSDGTSSAGEGSSSTPRAPKVKSPTDVDLEAEYIRTLPIVVFKNFASKAARGDIWNVMSEWGAGLVENKVAHVIVVTEGPLASKSLTKALPSKPLNTVSLADADEENSLAYVRDKLSLSSDPDLESSPAPSSSSTSPSASSSTSTSAVSGKEASEKVNSISSEDIAQIRKIGGRMVDLETVVYKVKTGSTITEAVDDIILRNVVELRKVAFGDDSEDAKNLPWTRQQAWKVISELAKNGELSYATLLQDFPFKGAEQSLKALEEHELVSVSYHEGRASKVRPGKPIFRYAFQGLVNDPVFRATCQIDYNTALISKAESDIKSYEAELSSLKQISTDGGDEALGISESKFLGLGKSSAVRERARWLLDKMGKSVEKLGLLEKDNSEMMKLLVGSDK